MLLCRACEDPRREVRERAHAVLLSLYVKEGSAVGGTSLQQQRRRPLTLQALLDAADPSVGSPAPAAETSAPSTEGATPLSPEAAGEAIWGLSSYVNSAFTAAGGNSWRDVEAPTAFRGWGPRGRAAFLRLCARCAFASFTPPLPGASAVYHTAAAEVEGLLGELEALLEGTEGARSVRLESGVERSLLGNAVRHRAELLLHLAISATAGPKDSSYAMALAEVSSTMFPPPTCPNLPYSCHYIHVCIH